MSDQATQLRQLALQTQQASGMACQVTPRKVLFVGGCECVGTTTLALGLACAWGQLGQHLVLIDAHPMRGDIAARCGLSAKHSVAEVINARFPLQDALENGPAGMRILPGRSSAMEKNQIEKESHSLLLHQLATLERDTAAVLVDMGHSLSDTMRQWWQVADDIVLVSTPDVRSVLNAYAIVKALGEASRHATLRLIVNRAHSAEHAADVHRRIARSCERFLQRDVRLLGHVPTSDELASASSLTTSSPRLSRTMDQMAAVLAKATSSVMRTSDRVAA